MHKLSTRIPIIILTFVIGSFAVAGWFYYQKFQPNQVLIPNVRRDLLLFNGVSEIGGINRVTELSELPKLREAHLQKGDIEVRIWRGFSLSPLEGVFLRRTDGQWSGLHITTDEHYEPKKAKAKLLNPPKSGWETFWQKLVNKEILTLPQSTKNECDIPEIDGIGYVVEINQDKIYRYYFYPSGNGKKCREAKQMDDIGEFIGLEFDSGQEECKMAEWFPCMTRRKLRGE